jgi:glycine dehydrogenase subunit 1
MSRRRVLISRALHPQYRAVVRSYCRNLEDIILEEAVFDRTGATDPGRLAQQLDDRTMCVVVGYPNFFGVIEDLRPVAAACARIGAQLIAVTTEPLALGLIKPPGELGVDIAVGEGQSLGVPMNLGGPAFGFFACRKKFVRSIPGRLVGETVDSDGRRGFVLTLATREQHIRREKATSNICTSQTLCALAATVYMSLMGKTGMRRLAEINLGRAQRARARLVSEAGLSAPFSGPHFNEFVVSSPRLSELLQRCSDQQIIPGIPLEQWYPELSGHLLVCVTEMNDPAEVERLVEIATG